MLDHMKYDYKDLNVVLLDSTRQGPPSGPYSTLYVGNFNSKFLGLADNVDVNNAGLVQKAIIYAEDISLFEGLRPSAEEVGLALANIASHELGHLLGLEHAKESGDLMATAATARQVLEVDAGFLRSHLQPDVFPTGWQNGPALLTLNVGAKPSTSGSRMRLDDVLPKSGLNFRDIEGLTDIPIMQCGDCKHAEGH
jgi:hypothetical protein